MIQKIATAFKNMAKQKMMRGDFGAAEAITSLGDSAAKNILRNQPQNVITQKTSGSTGVHGVFVKEETDKVKGQVGNNSSQNTNKNVGSSILDAIK